MAGRGRRAAIGVTVVVLSSLVGGGVIAATRPSDDDSALQPARQPGDPGVERRIDQLISKMTVDEKLQQLQLLSDGQITDEDARKGVGGVFSLVDPKRINELQHIAVEESPNHIPILFAYDTIHGFRTIFPIPLGAASSFDPAVAETDHAIGARESATVGLKQIYSPMVDVSHEPRWGRISEAGGEDPYLGSVFAAARVKGAQGANYAAPDKVVTSVKHLAAYGQPEGGRDYNTTDMSEQRLRNFYLPPFKAAVDAGSDTAMCSFNAVSGVPGCANNEIETDILKKEWNFDGFIESDYTAVAELRACPPVIPPNFPCGHGVAEDGADAAQLALNAGTDSEMVSTLLRDNGKQLLAQGRISMARVNDAVRRILRVKFRAGLFEQPYVDQAKAKDEASFLKPEDRAAARNAAGRSMVLLKNADKTLPLDTTKSVAVIGPLGNNKHDMLGPWWGRGKDEDAVTVFEGIKNQNTNPDTAFEPGCTIEDKEPPNNTPEGECGSDAGFNDAVAAASKADQVVLALGESRGQSGEAASRVDIDLPGRQQELIDRIMELKKPTVVVLFNGRPLTLSKVDAAAPAILEAWFPGVEAGNAVADVLFGKVNPGGKLPVSFPQRVGQIPIYYNHEPTGRPCDAKSKYNSRYRDLATCAPLYEFGYGLSYTKFELTNLQLSSHRMSSRGGITASVDVTNTGDRKGDEVAQLYINDPVASISQPVRRLRGFQRVTLAAGEKRTVTWKLDASDVGFYDNRGRFIVEPGKIYVFAGQSSTGGLQDSFEVVR
jgi:beta-glucosidase